MTEPRGHEGAASEPEQHPDADALRAHIASLERELGMARERLRQLEEADYARTDFAFTISHELRTPLTLISGYAQKLLLRWQETDEERRRGMVEKINVSSHRLSRLVDDILLLTDVERGALSILTRNVAVTEVVEQALGELSDRYPNGLPPVEASGPSIHAMADGFRLEQVLISLLDNAVKHSPHGATITLTWEIEDRWVLIKVADQGGGIDDADVARVFARFGRLERAMGQSRGGVGLGLYIARRLTEAMNGRIWVDSIPGVGSTFCVAVPMTSKQ